MQATWRDDPGPDGIGGTADDLVTLPADDLDAVLEDRARLAARVRVLTRAGRFVVPGE